MDAYKEEALRAKEYAEKRFSVRDYVGAKDFALKAQTLYPNLEGISQMITTFGIYLASEIKVQGEPDCYSILGVDPAAGKVEVKKQYKKLAGLLHPDTNKTLGAEGAYKLISEAWLILSDMKKRRKFDRKKKKHASLAVVQANISSVYTNTVTNLQKPAASHGLDTFWTVCTSCQVQYEYLRKYLNKKLSCKNCRGVFVAVETGNGPVNGAFPYSNWSNVPANGYKNHGHNNPVTYPPKTDIYFTENAASGYHSGHSTEFSFQWGQSGVPAGTVNAHGSSTKSKIRNGVNEASNVLIGYNEPSLSKGAKPYKKRKLERSYRNGNEDLVQKVSTQPNLSNENGNAVAILNPEMQSETLARGSSSAPLFDTRKLLMEKSRAEIIKNLKIMNATLGVVPTGAVSKNTKVPTGGALKNGTLQKRNTARPFRRLELKRTSSMPIKVPDSDFHDFDKVKSEECFKPKQIWAIYDEEDGMPRLYCLIREVISVKPFKIQVGYLNAKTDTEFGDIKWVVYGFTKSCGSFRVFNSDVVEEVNLFSHVLEGEKTGRGGCVRIYPRSGDIWAVYKNWSPDWTRKTPYEVRHQYEMVVVLDNYNEESGLNVSPLVKLDGYKTVYQRIDDKNAIRHIPKNEMVRFSHQVPSWRLKGHGFDFPDGCWDLDPAATPDELLQGSNDTKIDEEQLSQVEN